MGKAIGKLTDAVGLTDIKGTERSAAQAAEAQRQAALQGAQVSAFRPVGMTTRFGRSMFDITDVGGVPRVTGAEYQISPELVALQDALMGLTGGALGTAQQAQMAAQPLGAAAQGLFNLGAGFMAESPTEARQRIFNELQAARDPARIQEEQRLASTVFGRGRAGLNIGGMGQPELYSLAQAREAQRAADIVAANQQAQQQLQFGTGLFGTGAQLLGSQFGIPTQALGPLQSLLGTVGSIEELGQQPFRLGLAVGSAAQPGADIGGRLLTTGGLQAAETQRAGAQAASNQLTNAVRGLFSSGLTGLNASGGFGAGGGMGGLQAMFAQTGLGRSGFGTGLAYGNQDYGMYF